MLGMLKHLQLMQMRGIVKHLQLQPQHQEAGVMMLLQHGVAIRPLMITMMVDLEVVRHSHSTNTLTQEALMMKVAEAVEEDAVEAGAEEASVETKTTEIRPGLEEEVAREHVSSVAKKVTCPESALLVGMPVEVVIEPASNVEKRVTCPESAQLVVMLAEEVAELVSNVEKKVTYPEIVPQQEQAEEDLELASNAVKKATYPETALQLELEAVGGQEHASNVMKRAI